MTALKLGAIFPQTEIGADPGALRAWTALGGTHLMINTMRAGLDGPDDHIKAIWQIKEVIDAMQ